jgi:hypothetical protein
MKSTKPILIITIISFVAIAATLQLLVIFELAPAAETSDAIAKLAQASAVIAAALIVILGLSKLGSK